PLQSLRALALELPLNGVANMSGHVLKIRQAPIVSRNATPVVGDTQVMLTSFAAPNNGYIARRGIDAVLDELGQRFQRILLRKGNDRNCVPVIAYPKPAGIFHASGITK